MGTQRNCLTCKWEPEWNDWVGVEFRRCYGKCRCPVNAQTLPATYSLVIKSVERFSDDSGLPSRCYTWEEKE